MRDVSIHARTWRATCGLEVARGFVPMFQSTPARGGRHRTVGKTGYLDKVSIHARTWRATNGSAVPAYQCPFQSTPARGGRLCLTPENTLRPRFQSTPARGGRHLPAVKRRGHHAVSIHARTWRATGVPARFAATSPCFNPRPHVAGDECPTAQGLIRQVSIHARTWRATRVSGQHARQRKVSIHARTWRATWPACRA